MARCGGSFRADVMVQPHQLALDTPVIAGTLCQDGTGIPVRWKSAGAVPERLPLPDGVSPQGQILDMEQDGTMLGRIGTWVRVGGAALLLSVGGR